MLLKLFSRIRRWGLVFPLAALAALTMLVISETSYRESATALDELGRMAVARENIHQLWRSLLDAETGQRGYLLTGRKEYLPPYDAAQKQADAALQQLASHHAIDGAALPLLNELRTLSAQKLSELSTGISLYDEGRTEAWRELLMTNIGQEKMDAIRSSARRLLEMESVRIDSGQRGINRTLLLSRIGVLAMTAFSLLALFMYLRQTRALESQRVRQQGALRAERDFLETEVDRRTEQLTELARHLQTAREDERNRLARDLHDELGALLTAAKLDVARLKSRLGLLTPEATDRLTHLNETLNSGIALKRRIIEDLRPSSLSNLGLVAALEILTREFSDRSAIEVHCALEAVKLKPSAELMVYRLVQEALTNVAKYASASRVDVTLGTRERRVSVTVQDDGVGFEPSTRSAGHGLLGMRYRVESEGGRMRLESSPGHGTRLEASLPQHLPEAPAPDSLASESPNSATAARPSAPASN
ncbi:MAG: CHASE3 domain-containing protein [Burkholderiaceae bacterium]